MTGHPIKAGFAKNCILGRRLLEKGVRFVQLFNGAYQTGGEGSVTGMAVFCTSNMPNTALC